jgi:hypothetical protein
MRFIRLTTGPDGLSRFEDAELDLKRSGERGLEASDLLAAGSLRFLQLPPGWFQDQQPIESRQYHLVLAGVLDIEAGDGDVRRLGPGSVLLLEDTKSTGHRARVVGMGPVVVAVINVGTA